MTGKLTFETLIAFFGHSTPATCPRMSGKASLHFAESKDDLESSFVSTFSTNMTMSNLPGPGRALGKLYSKAGRSLEKVMALRERVEAEVAGDRLMKKYEACQFVRSFLTEALAFVDPPSFSSFKWIFSLFRTAGC